MDATYHFLNSHFSQSEAYAEYMQYLGWHVQILRTGPVKHFLYVRKIPFIGSVGKMPRPMFSVPLEKVQAIIKENRIQICRIEPNVLVSTPPADTIRSVCRSAGFQRTTMDCELKTVILDLKPEVKQIFSKIPRENTRRNIKIAQENGLITEVSDDIDTFITLHHKLGRRKRFYAPPKSELKALFKAFAERKAAMVVVILNKDHIPQAAVLVLIHNKVGYYRAAGVLDEPAVSMRAPTLAAWQAILAAKALGCIVFDFCGVVDDRAPNKRWSGFSHFKYGFTHETQTFIEPYAYYGKPFGPLLHLFDRFG